MPIIIDNREVKIPEEIPLVRERFRIPPGECLGCYWGDSGLEFHDIPDACEYLGGFLYELPTDEEEI